MDHHRTVAGIKIWFVPDTFINVLCRKYFTRMFHQKKQNPILKLRKIFLFSIYKYFIIIAVDPDIADLYIIILLTV